MEEGEHISAVGSVSQAAELTELIGLGWPSAKLQMSAAKHMSTR